jgi:UDP-glucose 4-epimerase
MRQEPSKQLLLVGAASAMAPAVVARFAKDYIITGIDSRPLPVDFDLPCQFIQIGYTKRRIADIFRTSKFDLLIHIGRIGSTSTQTREVRFEQNVYGTRNLLHLGLTHGISKFIVLSTHLVYGAMRDNPLYLREDEPLRASETCPELFDAIELDLETRAFLWRHRSVRTVLLRPAHILGPHAQHALATLMRAPYCPKLIGFDPLLQFVHEDDIARAIELASSNDIFGVYNVAGEGVIPYSRAIELAGSTPMPIPSFAAQAGVRLVPLLGGRLPTYVIDYIKYPVVISDEAFRKTVGWSPTHTTVDCLATLKA